jgi:hypothetical protein
MKANSHTLHVLNTSQPKLRKAIISICDRDVVNSINEGVLNVLNGNIALTGNDTPRLGKHILALCKLDDKQVPLSGKKRLIVQRGGLLLTLLAAVLPKLASLIATKYQNSCFESCISSRTK